MDILKAFSLLDIDYPINIQGTLEEPLFQANQIGKILGIVNIHHSLIDFSNNEKVCLTTATLGGNQEAMFLTELGLYRLLGRSKKPIAKKFQEWMVSVLKEIRLNGMYKLQQDKEIDKQLYQTKNEIAIHNTLLKAYDKKNVVYICKFYNTNDKFVIKIGSTQDVKERLTNISNSFNCQQPLLIDVFENDNYKKFEKKIHHNVSISQYYEKITKKDGTVSRETYLINDLIYKDFIRIINQIKCEFVPQDVKEIEEIKLINQSNQIRLAELKIQQLNIELEMKKIELELKNNNEKNEKEEYDKESTEESESDDDYQEEPKSHVEPNYVKKRNNGITIPKVYQYSPSDLINPIKIFDSPSDVERIISNTSTAALKRASANNTIYKEYRWKYVNRTEEPPEKIEETVPSKQKLSEVKYIAMIDIKKTKILAVYSSQKEAVESRNMKCNSFTRAIQQQHISSGHYWNFFEDCPIEMQEEYLKTNKLPEKYVKNNGTKIQKIDPTTKNVLSTYNSKRDIVKKYQISYNKLNSMIDTDSDEVYNGFIWKKI
jgi:prophage antirepressor-like protein